MIPDTIERDILINAPADSVWRAVTEPEQITQWFCDAAELDLRPGGEGTFFFDTKARTKPTIANLRVVTVEPPRAFAFRWSYPEGEEPREDNSMLVEFTLTPEGDNTRLRVTETGLHHLPWSDEEKATYADDHNGGWEHHLGSLRSYASQQSGVSSRR